MRHPRHALARAARAARPARPARPASGGCPGCSAFAVAAALSLFLTAPDSALAQGSSMEPASAAGPTTQPVDPALFADLEFRPVGPTRGGRVTAVAGHTDHPLTFYMGATGGGVWKTTDYGNTWLNVSDGFFHTGSIGAIRVAPSSSDVVYVGTGSDGIRSNVIVGKGVYRSDDAGATWEHLGLEDSGQIGAVEIDPRDPDRAYVAALGSPFGRNEQRGVFRTTDGGRSWDQVLFTSDSVGAIDLEIHPTNPRTLYATLWRGERKPWTIISGMEAAGGEDGIWKSTDGGDTWRRVEQGLPTGLIGKIDLAVTPADPDRVYAVVETLEPEEGLYRSDDAGETWRLVSNHEPLMDRPFYYTNVDADPTDADVVWVSATQLWKSTDGGETWQRWSTPHGDNHDLWINPRNPDILIQSNDGGANVSLDGGRTWSTQHNQSTAELYQVDVDTRFPYWLYAGQQDNSTIAVPSNPPAGSAPAGPEGWWEAIGGCETGPVVPRHDDPTIVYANCKGRFGRYSRMTGQEKQYYVGAVNMYGTNPGELPYRFQRVVPIEISPHDADVVYHGSQYVHRTTDDGVTWERISPDLTAFRPERQVISGGPITRDITGEEHYSTLYAIEVSPLDPDVIWTGANDGPVHVTTDGGATWTDVTPPGMPPEGRIQNIDPSPHSPGKAYVAGYRYLLNDFRPYIYRTEDYGQTWTLLTPGDNGIPADHPTRVVREDPEREGLLYAGTEFGMFVSFDDGARWQSFQKNLPVTPVTDIRVHEGDLALSTMGRGFWIMDDVSPLHELDERVAASERHLFQPEDAYRLRGGGFGGFGPRDPNRPRFEESGAVIDYWLASDTDEEVRLEILDARGDVVRGYSSDSEGYEVRRTQAMRGMEIERMGGPRLPADAGMHRARWDLSHPGAWSPRGGRSGPTAVPGRYTVRLSVGDWSATRPLTLRMDPRVEADGVTVADLTEQLELSLEIRNAISEAQRAAAEIDEAQDDLEGTAAGGGAMADEARAALRTLARIESALVTADVGSYPRPMLIDQLQYLYGMTARADQRPGQDAYARYAELQGQLSTLLGELGEVMEREVAPVVSGGGR